MLFLRHPRGTAIALFIAVTMFCGCHRSRAQVAVTPAPFVVSPYFNGALPCNGCLLYTYAAGTTTPLATYTDYTGVTPNANPVVLDSSGYGSVWLGPSAYKLVLKDSTGVTIKTVDGVVGFCPVTGCTLSAALNIVGSSVNPLFSVTQGSSGAGIAVTENGAGPGVSVSNTVSGSTGVSIVSAGLHAFSATLTAGDGIHVVTTTAGTTGATLVASGSTTAMQVTLSGSSSQVTGINITDTAAAGDSLPFRMTSTNSGGVFSGASSSTFALEAVNTGGGTALTVGGAPSQTGTAIQATNKTSSLPTLLLENQNASGLIIKALKSDDTTTAFSLSATGAVVAASSVLSSSPSAGVGYSAGAGCAVTQATDKSTGVSCAGMSGAITTNNANLGSATAVGFTVTDTSVASTDVVIVNIASGGTANSYTVTVDALAGGSFHISLRNFTGGGLAEAVVINFAIIKAVVA